MPFFLSLCIIYRFVALSGVFVYLAKCYAFVAVHLHSGTKSANASEQIYEFHSKSSRVIWFISRSSITPIRRLYSSNSSNVSVVLAKCISLLYDTLTVELRLFHVAAPIGFLWWLNNCSVFAITHSSVSV